MCTLFFTFSEKRSQVSLSLRPWLRICGSVNRRVLDRMLGTVLFLVMENPGISGTKLAKHLSPALLPVHVHDLLHMLYDLNCVRKYKIVLHSKPSTLFSGTQLVQTRGMRAVDLNCHFSVLNYFGCC